MAIGASKAIDAAAIPVGKTVQEVVDAYNTLSCPQPDWLQLRSIALHNLNTDRYRSEANQRVQPTSSLIIGSVAKLALRSMLVVTTLPAAAASCTMWLAAGRSHAGMR